MKYISLLIVHILANHIFSNPIQSLEKHCMSSQTWEEEDWPNEPFQDFLHRCMQYQKNLQPFKKSKAAWGIIQRTENWNQISEPFVLNNDSITWENLQIFSPKHEEALDSYLVKKIDRTKLALGRRVLETWIAYPKGKNSIDELKQKQEIVKYLLKNANLYEKIEEEIEALKLSENLMLSFWLNDPLYNASSKNYFQTSSDKIDAFLNKSTPVLSCNAIWSHTKRITECVSAVWGFGALVQQGLLWSPVTEASAMTYLGTAGPIFAMSKNYLGNWMEAPGFWKAFYLSAAAYSVKIAKESYDRAQDNIILQKYLQEKLIHAASHLKAMTNIEQLFLDHPILSEALFSESTNPFKNLRKESEELFHLLGLAAFEKNPSFFTFPGPILKAYRELREHRDVFEKPLLTVGKIDALMSIARLYKEFEKSRIKYCFVQFVDSENIPYIFIENLWNPLIDKKKTIANPVHLGGIGTARNMILTGPNEGGKSSYAKAVATSLILGQSLGIMPAEKAVITPFDYIGTYLNITDDEGKSLFEAQVKRAKELLDQIDRLEKTQFAFLMLDEMFNGTNAKTGELLTYNYAEYLSRNTNLLSIFPTHFPFLTTLEEKNSQFANYCVTAHFTALGRVEYQYKIVPGIWTVNVAKKILQKEGFPDVFLKEIEDHF